MIQFLFLSFHHCPGTRAYPSVQNDKFMALWLCRAISYGLKERSARSLDINLNVLAVKATLVGPFSRLSDC